VIKALAAAGKTVVIPPKSHSGDPRKFDTALYEARHLIEIFFCWINSSGQQPRATTRQSVIFNAD
jgi:transposase